MADADLSTEAPPEVGDQPAARSPRLRRRRSTATSNFGAGSRESHDASAFYGRFRPPAVSSDATVAPPSPVTEPFVVGDARDMDQIADNSVALVVTSPPYFAGKQYEEEIEREGVPASYLEYLQLLTDVFAECVRTLEPGGRIAVNVANLGRKPYRSLSADVIRILQHDLGLLLRAEIVWQKGEGANGSCAWGSFRSAANPVVRDVTERVIVASKGRFDRARTPEQRRREGLPHRSTIATDDFLALTLDVWSIPPESARRVGHPAPFPVELPEQLIRLYTYEGDLVLDPFMGSGSTLVAASRLGRRYAGYDLDPAYVDIARRRVAEEGTVDDPPFDLPLSASKLIERSLRDAGFTITGRDKAIGRTGTTVDVVADDATGTPWHFLTPGQLTAHRAGLASMDLVWRTIGRATALAGGSGEAKVVVLTTALPRARTPGDQALRAAGPAVIHDAIDVTSDEDRARLAAYARGERDVPGFW